MHCTSKQHIFLHLRIRTDTKFRIPKTENTNALGVTEEEGGEIVLYCDEQFYHMFRLLYILYTRWPSTVVTLAQFSLLCGVLQI